jgi:hypothetical protein
MTEYLDLNYARNDPVNVRHTAFHEAAHACIARQLGIGVKLIDLYDEGPQLGRTRIVDPNNYLAADASDDMQLGATQANLLVLMAGAISDQLLGADISGATSDWQSIWRRAGLGLDSIKGVGQLEKLAYDMVKQLWPQISKLAEELLRCRSLDSQDIEQILGAKQNG